MRGLKAALALVLVAFPLSACTSTDSATGPSRAGAGASTGAAAPKVPDAAASIAFAPAVGAPAEVVPALREGLTQRAAERGITIAADGTPGADAMLKGYFSAIADGTATTVIYVWDVLDAAGTRLHRIQGQESVPGGSDGWSSVTPAAMQAIGRATIDAYADWVSGRRVAAQ